MEILLWSFAFLLTVLFFLQKGIRFALFRTVGWVLSVAVVVTLNVNWLLGKPITLGILGIGVLLGVVFAVLWGRKRDIWKNPFARMKADEWVPIFVFLGAFFLGWQYLGFQWDAPRYATPDPGTHTMYMFQTAQTGLMPMFSESRIYPASNYEEGWKTHHLSYFPGSTAVFFVVNMLSPLGMLETFQLFNVVMFALVCAYFFALSMRMFRGVWRYLSFGIFSFVLLYGVFFEFVVASFTTQLLGLFFLLFFADMYHRYRQGVIPIWFPLLGLSSIIVSYVYWLPVAFLFIFFERLSDIYIKEFSWRIFFRWVVVFFRVPLGAIFLSWGYVLVAHRVNLLGYSSADGGFPVQKEILRDVIVVIPFAVFSVYLLMRRWLSKRKANLILNLFLASFIYSFGLIFLYIVSMRVSHYTAFKSLYLLLPLVWLLALSYMTRTFSFFRDILREKRMTFDLIRFRKYVLLFGGIYVLVFCGTYFANISWKGLSLQKQNMTFVRGNGGIGYNLTRDQWQLLDVIKRDYSDILREGRVFVVAPPDTALWIFSYSGIWPRTLATTSPERSLGGGFGLDPLKVIDYKEWFDRDPDRILVYFRTKESKKWIAEENVPLGQYEVLYAIGDNAIYKWKGDKK